MISFTDLLDSAGLKQRVSGPTHNCGHTLDLIIDREDESLLCGNQEIISDVPSDHSLVICRLNLPKPNPTKMIINRRNLHKVNLNLWREDILKSRLHIPLSGATDVDNLVDQYNNVLLKLIENHAPVVTRSVTVRSNSPWYTTELRLLKQEKRRCERKYLSSRLVIHWQIYREKCRAYGSALNAAKFDYYRNRISDADQNQLFQMINGLFKVRQVHLLPSHTSLPSLVEKFPDHFSSKIQSLRTNLQNSRYSSMELSVSVQFPTCKSSLGNFVVVSENHIRTIVQQSKSKSCLLDPIPTKLLKQSIDVLIGTLTIIVNKSLSSGVFPTSFKKGLVHPTIKKRSLDCEEFQNYRPITNLAYLSKILERVVANQIMDYLGHTA